MPRTERMARMQPTTRTKSCRGVDVAELHSYAYGFDRIITTKRPAKIKVVWRMKLLSRMPRDAPSICTAHPTHVVLPPPAGLVPSVDNRERKSCLIRCFSSWYASLACLRASVFML